MKPEGKAFDRVSSNEDKRPPARVSGRAHLRFHGSWPSLASKSTSECARKHGKINDMPDTGEGGEGRVAESGVSSSSGEGGGGGGNTNRSRIASLLFALPRPLPHPELHTCQSSRPSERHLAPSSSFLALRWEDIASRCFNCRPNARYLVASVVFNIIIFFFRERRVSKFVDFRIRRSSTGKFVESFALFRLRQLPLPLLLFGKNKIIKRDRKESNEFRLSEYA